MPLRRSGRALLLMLPAAVLTGFQQPAPTPTPKDWRVRFAREARQHLRLMTVRPPEFDIGVPSTATLTGGLRVRVTPAPAAMCAARAAGAVLAQITSAGAYPRLGLAPGVNYLWVDTVGGKTRQLVIPADTAYPTRWLRVVQHDHAPLKSAAARLVVYDTAAGGPYKAQVNGAPTTGRPTRFALAACTCNCGAGWCSGSQVDEAATQEIPVAAILRSVAREPDRH